MIEGYGVNDQALGKFLQLPGIGKKLFTDQKPMSDKIRFASYQLTIPLYRKVHLSFIAHHVDDQPGQFKLSLPLARAGLILLTLSICFKVLRTIYNIQIVNQFITCILGQPFAFGIATRIRALIEILVQSVNILFVSNLNINHYEIFHNYFTGISKCDVNDYRRIFPGECHRTGPDNTRYFENGIQPDFIQP